MWTWMIPLSDGKAAKRLLRTILFMTVLAWGFPPAQAAKILIPMDKGQTDHLKAYGIVYWTLESDVLDRKSVV